MTQNPEADLFHGCLTGDCDHDKQTECDAAIDEQFKKARTFWVVGLREGAIGCSAVIDKKHLGKYAKEDENDAIKVLEAEPTLTKIKHLENMLTEEKRMSGILRDQRNKAEDELRALRKGV